MNHRLGGCTLRGYDGILVLIPMFNSHSQFLWRLFSTSACNACTKRLLVKTADICGGGSLTENTTILPWAKDTDLIGCFKGHGFLEHQKSDSLRNIDEFAKVAYLGYNQAYRHNGKHMESN